MIIELASMKYIGAYAVSFIAPPLVGMITYFGAIELNSGALAALGVSALFSSLTAYFAAKPKMVTATSDAEIKARQQSMSEWSQLLKAQQESANEQISKLREMLAKKDEMIDKKERYQALMRITKHNAIDAYGAATLHIQLLESMLKDAKQTIPPFKARTFKEITGVEDEEAVNIVKQ